MIIKATLLFLIAMLALGMFGKLRIPKIRKTDRTGTAVRSAQKCKTCQSYVVGSPTACGRADCPYGASS